jgi:hypothetical protein
MKREKSKWNTSPPSTKMEAEEHHFYLFVI